MIDETEYIYVYVCGFYSSDDYRKKHTLGVYCDERDALNKMIQLCKTDENNGGYLWLFNGKIEQCDLDEIATYEDFNKFMTDHCVHYYIGYLYYLYIEKVRLR